MLESYFFIPANRIDFFKKIHKIDADNFIIDFEDSINNKTRIELSNEFLSYIDIDTFFVRPNLWVNGKFSLENVIDLKRLGFKNFVIPKIFNSEQLHRLLNLNLEGQIILLVETPHIIPILPDVINRFQSSLSAIGFGSQDFSMYTGTNNNLQFLNYARFQINIVASANSLKFIDTASMIIDDEKKFEDECINAFESGCTGKFIIHPKQLTILKSANYISDSEIKWSLKVQDYIESLTNSDLEAVKIDGQVLERPHILRVKKIINYLNNK